MKRNLNRLVEKEYDLLVIGSGIYGACVAWDAALRGLSVALVDKGDFGHATSANSLKIIHGGLRYLQDANLQLMRTMIRERTTWMRIAPHLVHPLPCLMPTSNKRLTGNKVALWSALKLNDLISYDRNRLRDPQKNLPNGRIISRVKCLQLLPYVGINGGVTGGAIWHDAQIHNSERLLLSFVLSAVEAGVEAANYVEVTGFLGDDTQVKGAKAQDLLNKQVFDIRAKMVVNCTGAWVDSLLGFLRNRSFETKFHLSTAMNLVTRRILPDYAVGILSSHTDYDRSANSISRSRMLFFVPWREYSLIGTIHAPYFGKPQDYQLTKEAVQNFIDEINMAYPEAALTRKDVYHVHTGFLPMVKYKGPASDVRLVRQSLIHDHEEEDNVAGLITVVGVKYTTARNVAEQVIDLVIKKLDQPGRSCRTHQIPLYGGAIDRFEEFLAEAIRHRPSELNPDIIKHLVYNYGSEYSQILNYLNEEPAWGQTITNGSPVIKAEIIHAVHREMAQKLSDVVQRRTELGITGLPDKAALQECAELMAAELGWNQARKEMEIDHMYATYAAATIPANEKIGVN